MPSGDQRAHQPRSGGIGDAVDVAALEARRREHLVEQGNQLPYVIAGGELRHHAAVLGVHARLAVKQVRAQTRRAVVDGDSGLVTGSLDSQYPHAQLQGVESIFDRSAGPNYTT